MEKVYDWTIPPEWNVKNAYIKCENKTIVDFRKQSSFSIVPTPQNRTVDFNELNENLYSLKKSLMQYLT